MTSCFPTLTLNPNPNPNPYPNHNNWSKGHQNKWSDQQAVKLRKHLKILTVILLKII